MRPSEPFLRPIVRLILLLWATALCLPQARAEPPVRPWPARPVTLIVPFPAGGPTDRVARDLARAMQGPLGAVVRVENVAGVGGTLGTARVAKSAADGYTLLFTHVGMAAAPALYRGLQYKPLEDFEYLGLVNEVPLTLVGRAGLPAHSYAEFSKWVRDQAGKVVWAQAGLGSASHLCALMLQHAMGVHMVSVAYKGTAPAMNDLIAGHVDVMCDQTTNTLAPIEAGRVQAYAVSTAQRLSGPLSRLPTLQEAGLPGFALSIWHGLYAPRGTPAATALRINEALRVALADPVFVSKEEALGAAVVKDERTRPDAHRRFVEAETRRLLPLLKASGSDPP